MEQSSLLTKTLRSEKSISDGYLVDETAKGLFKVLLDIPKTVLEDTQVSIRVDTYISNDNVNWRYYAGFTYVGGKHEAITGIAADAPGIIVFADELKGKYIKVEMTVNKEMIAGTKTELWQ